MSQLRERWCPAEIRSKKEPMNSIQPLLNRSTRSELRLFETRTTATALQGWKNIASHLERGVRTVQRWERDLALPVHRIGKGPRGGVFAFADELRSWLHVISDLHPCADFAVASNPLPRQETPLRIVNRLRQATLPEDGPGNPWLLNSPIGRNLEAVIKFFAAQCSTRPPGDCEQCHSPLRTVEGYFRMSGTERSWVTTIRVCPICDQETIGGPGARQCVNSRDNKLHSPTPMEA